MATPLTFRKKITITTVETIPPNAVVWDTSLKGFCIRRQSGDAVSYRLKLRVNGRQRFVTIGRHGHPWSPDTARKHALKILGNPDLATKPVSVENLPFPTVASQFFTLHGPKLKPRSLEEYQRLNRLYLVPAFGKFLIRDITKAMVANAHSGWAEFPRAANHAIAVLSKMMAWCEDQGYCPERTNPCTKIERFGENRREIFLTSDQLGALARALDDAEAKHLVGPFALAAIRLLIFTGARLNEILTLQWAWVDVQRQIIFLPDSKTGQKPIVLNDAALRVLTTLPRLAGNPYVICGHLTGERLINLQKPWRTVRALAGLDQVRLHDLRHTFASYAAASGGSLPIIGKALGHTQPQTTQRYAHLAEDSVRRLSQATGEALSQAMKPKTGS